MSTSFDPDSELLITRLVIVALALGVLVFAALATFSGPLHPPQAPVLLGLDMLELVAVVLTLSALPAALTIPPKIASVGRGRDPQLAARSLRAARIVGAALCEGAAFLWCVTLLLSGERWHLAPIALCTALLLAQIPSRAAFDAAIAAGDERG